MNLRILFKGILMLLPMLFTVSLKSQVVNCNIFNYSNPGSCHTANIECVMIIDQAFVDANEGDIMLARLDAERVFDSIKLRMTPLLTSQGYATTFRLVHFPDFVAPNNWYNGSSAYWIGKVSEYWNTNPKKCIKRDVIILLSGQEPPFHGVSNGISICNPEIPNANKVCIIRKDGMEAKALGHELMHNFGLQHLDEDPNCDHFCYDSDPHTKDPLMCSAGTGDWHFTSCDRSCLSTFFDASKCACLQIVHPDFASDFTCPTTASIGFSVVADNPNPVLNCKMGGDTVTLTITLVNDSTTTNRNIRAFVNTTDNAFVEFVPDPSTNFNCVVPIPGSRTEFRITNTVNTACSDETSFSLIPGETKTVTLKFRYKGGITFQQGNIGTNSFRIFVYTGMIHNANNSISIYPFVEKSGGTTNIWDSSNPVLVNGQLTLNTGLPIVLGLNNNNTPNNENNKILFTAGSSIEINSQNSLKLVHAQIEGCDNMWKGITVKQGGNLEMTTMTSVKDAQHAINVQKGGALIAKDCKFLNNNYSIITAPDGVGVYNLSLLGNIFATDGDMKSPYSGQSPTPYENRGYAGISLENAGSLVLQSSPGQSINHFNTLHHGIISINTNLSIKNTVFENIEKIPGVPGLPSSWWLSPGKAIYSNGGSLYVTGEGTQAADPVTFMNCYAGIESVNSSLTVTQNKMRSVSTGILSRIALTKNLSITFNDVEAKELGIGVYHSAALGNGCIVKENKVDMIGSANGIGISTGGSGDFIQFNGLFQTNIVTVADGRAGINVGVASNLKVTQNNITLGNASTLHGIGIFGGDLNTINCNIISGSGEKGIYGMMAGRSAFVCNTTSNTNHGLFFEGVFLGKGTIPVAGNTMNNNSTAGMLLESDAVIGDQVHRGNIWTGGLTNAEHKNPTLALKSSFSVDPNENTTFVPNVFIPTNWFQLEPVPQQSYQCIPSTSCPSIASIPDFSQDKTIAKSELTGFVHQREQLWLAQRRLYERLTEEGNPYPNDPDINAFLLNAQSNGLKGYADLQTGLRQLFNVSTSDLNDLNNYEIQIGQNMKQLELLEFNLNVYGISLVDSTNLAKQRDSILQNTTTYSTLRSAKLSSIANTRFNAAETLLTQNSTLGGAYTHLMNEKIVNSIFIQTIASNSNGFSEIQASSLQVIADQCPLEGGVAVFRARDMLALIQDTPAFYDDDVLCSANPRPTSQSSNVATRLEAQLLVFPNPAKTQINIQYDVENNKKALLEFFSIYGQKVKEVALNDTIGMLTVPVENLVAGVYFYTLDGVAFGQLVISR